MMNRKCPKNFLPELEIEGDNMITSFKKKPESSWIFQILEYSPFNLGFRQKFVSRILICLNKF